MPSIRFQEISLGSTASKLAAVDAVAKDQLDRVPDRLLVGEDRAPVLLDGDQHDIVEPLLRDEIFLVVLDDTLGKAGPAAGRRCPGRGRRPRRSRRSRRGIWCRSPRRWRAWTGRSDRRWPATCRARRRCRPRPSWQSQAAGTAHRPSRQFWPSSPRRDSASRRSCQSVTNLITDDLHKSSVIRESSGGEPAIDAPSDAGGYSSSKAILALIR